MTSTTADYPPKGEPVTVDRIDAFLATLDRWQDDRGPRLVELDERVQLHGSTDEREAIALAFVLWKAIGLRLDELRARRGRGRADDCRRVSEAVWEPLDDEVGTSLTRDLPEAVGGVEDIWRRLDELTRVVESRTQEVAAVRSAAESDLAEAERLSHALGDQVRNVASLRQRFGALGRIGPDDDDKAADLSEVAAAIAGIASDLRDTEATRRRVLDQLDAAGPTIERLRGLEADLRATADRCVEKVADPPRLAIPSVDALGVPPSPPADATWSAVRAPIEQYLHRVDRLERAIDHAATAYRAPLARRDELRGLVQAYRDKADAKGVAERADIDGAYQAARRELWAAPCRIDEAEQLVAEYQRVVNGAAPAIDSGPGASP